MNSASDKSYKKIWVSSIGILDTHVKEKLHIAAAASLLSSMLTHCVNQISGSSESREGEKLIIRQVEQINILFYKRGKCLSLCLSVRMDVWITPEKIIRDNEKLKSINPITWNRSRKVGKVEDQKLHSFSRNSNFDNFHYALTPNISP